MTDPAPPPLGPEVEAFLRACSAHYDLLVDKLAALRRSGRPEAILTWIEMAAGFAAMNHAGRFADGAIENVALALGAELPQTNRTPPRSLREPPAASGDTRRRVLHISTVVMSVSGHMRTILNWIRKDARSRHSLLLTRQGNHPIPPELLETVAAAGGNVIAFPDTAPIGVRAAWLRELAPVHGDLAILHLIPDDIVPVVAFAAETRIPVSLVNLADQCFWVGSTVADATINLRDISAEANRVLRFTRNEQLVPIPLTEPPALSTEQAREKLGIPTSQTVLLTIGRAIKYAPSQRQSFFQTAARILDGNPGVHLYAVGVGAADHARSKAFVNHERMHFVGSIPDPSLYQAAATVYLEGFPFGSQTALLESVLPGVPCVRAVAPLTPLLAASDTALEGVAPVPQSESAYVDLASHYLSEPLAAAQTGQALRERVRRYHVDQTWNDMLESAYAAISSLTHQPREIPVTAAAARPVDLAISEYHGTRFADQDPNRAVDNLVRSSIFGSAYAARERGCHMESLQLIGLSNYGRRWWSRRAIVAAAKLLPHKLLSLRGNRD